MTNIVAMCTVLHNLCIINNERIEENLIVEAENKLGTRLTKE